MSTYTPIASQTLSASASSVTFSGIPQNYTDLVIVASAKSTSAGASDQLYGTLNGDTGNNYSQTWMEGNGSSAASGRSSNGPVVPLGQIAVNSDTSAFSPNIFHLMNYSNTTTYKTILNRYNRSSAYVGTNVILWRSTSAINTLLLFTQSGSNFAAGSTFNLYGIDASLSAQAKATGGTTIIRDSSYWYHVFTGSGTFTPTQAITADYLIVAGGGGGGNYTTGGVGGGGGAGGLRAFTGASLTSGTSYTVTVGAGGSRGTTGGGQNGNTTTFNSNSVSGGGGGGCNGRQSGNNGGSGGGGQGSGGTGGSGNTGSYSPAEGTSGGSGGGANAYSGGGGGGASASGSNGTGSAGGNGGAGASIYNSIDFSSWLTATSTGSSGKLAGGGGGGAVSGYTFGTGGTGGGGTAGGSSAGLANTGSGGAGNVSSSGDNAGNGGSGIVIIRYAV